ncbi:shikimate dehydrogenase [Radiobacillus deserti]|uniref:Shikimate dehydrogenase (NADP(+)) n=1 Tax=Radiobacillus deserti TaxID=2594883 RepID=A0A516KH21_9BACI|nr:shikimate dehydrogenase [Radiobacillus deserti]QDP40675.1 shikimate dehydrogenase [Radiobacillus deserti]
MGITLGLIGFPAKHSLSPWIHGAFMDKAGIEGTYTIYETKQDDLEQQLKKLKMHGIDGFNVTVPYKQTIMNYLDDIDDAAAKIGAVNTVLQQNGKWIGYNTDGLGYQQSLRTAFPNLFSGDKHVLILGAGGASRGIYYTLSQGEFPQVDIANRTKEKAEAFLPLKSDRTDSKVIDYKEAERVLSTYDLIVQTTSVGMKPHVNEQVIKLEKLSTHSVVSDIVYQPIQTQLLEDAEKRGAYIHHGHAMLLYQAQAAFQIWTGKQPQVDSMLLDLEKRLRGD